MRFLAFLLAVLCLLFILFHSDAVASVFSETSKEQLYLLERRGLLHPDDWNEDVTRLLRDSLEPFNVEAMHPKELRRLLLEKRTECHGCLERRDLVQKVLEVRRVRTAEENISQLFVALDDSIFSTHTAQENAIFVNRVVKGIECQAQPDGSIICF